MSFKNRMIIASSQGPLLLTIPIIGGRDQKTPLRDILIAYDAPWREQHFKSLVTSYQRSPYFEFYKDSLQALYSNKPAKLVDFLMLCQTWINKQIKAEWTILAMNQSNEFITSLPEKQLPIWIPKNYNNCPGILAYQQVFSDRLGFLNNVCILDMLFCCGGKETKQALSV